MSDDEEILHVAGNALKEIEAGRARGFKWPLYGRAVVEYFFELLAKLYTYNLPTTVFLFSLVLIVYAAFCIGFVVADVEEEVNGLVVKVEDQRDLDYTTRFLGGDAISLEVTLQEVSGDCDSGNNYTASLLDHLRIVRSIIDMPVELYGRNFTFRDLCTYVPFQTTMPDFDRVMNGLHTCAMFTPLDCFWEGSILQNPLDSIVVEKPSYCDDLPDTLTWSNFEYDKFAACLRNNSNESMANEQTLAFFDTFQFIGYTNKYCFGSAGCPEKNRPTSPVDLNAVFDDVSRFQNLTQNFSGCVAASTTSVAPLQLIRGLENCKTYDLVRVIRTTLILNGPDSLQSNLEFSHNITLNQSDILNLLDAWKNQFFLLSIDYDINRKLSADLIVSSASNLNQRLANQLSTLVPALLIIGYLLMIIFCGLAFSRFAYVKSRGSVGLVGVVIVILGTAGALGITAAAGLKLTLLTTQIYPFLVLGLGVDDMFVIVGAYLEIERKKGFTAPIKELIRDTMVSVGPSVTLTSITNFVGFLLVYVIPLPIFRNLVVEIAVAIFLNYIGLIVAMPCYLVIDHYRVRGQFVDVFCCFPARLFQKKKDKDKNKGNSSKLAVWVSEVNEKYQSFITYFVVNYYSPFLQFFIVKLGTLVIFFVLLGISIWGCFRVEEIVSLEDFTEAGSPDAFYAQLNERYFRTDPFAIVTKEFPYNEVQPQLLEMDTRVREIDNVLTPTASNRFWLRVMIEFFQNFQTGICFGSDRTQLLGVISLVDPSVNITTLDPCTYELLITDPTFNVTIIPPDRFYFYLRVWATFDALNLGLLAAFLNPPPVLYDFMSPFEPAEPLIYAQANFYADQLITVTIGENFLIAIQNIFDAYEGVGIDAYILGLPYITYSQYLDLESQILTGAMVIIAACFVSTSIFLMDLHSGIAMAVILIVNAVNVLGFIGHFKIGMSYFPAMMYLAGIAVAVEFTAPMTFYFLKATPELQEDKYAGLKARGSIFYIVAVVLTELDQRNERMHRALEHRFTPILNGAITTFISVMMLYFAPIQFIRSYFWGILMIIIVMGLLNGLLFLPVLLSLFGPFPQAWPVANGKTENKDTAVNNPISIEEVKEKNVDVADEVLEKDTAFN